MLFSLEKISFIYPDGTPALLDISAEIQAGERIALLGSNGSGKSTLLRILDGLIFPTEGQICFRGEPLTEKRLGDSETQYRFRQSVGFVFQDADAQLFNASVWEEVAFAPRQLGINEEEVQQRVFDVLAFLGIEHLAERAPFRLSGGEKRKVAIAGILSMNPDVILFDEPIAGLDPRMQSWLYRTLKQLQDIGRTTIVATHHLESLPIIADRALILSEEHRLIGSFAIDEALRDENMLLNANLIGQPIGGIR